MGVKYGHLSPVEAATQNSRFQFTEIRQKPCKTRICWFPGESAMADIKIWVRKNLYNYQHTRLSLLLFILVSATNT